MSRVVSDPGEIRDFGLVPITPDAPLAFLVESFNRILISKINFSFQRGIQVFEEKKDLLPFEEAKLYGQKATHALAANLGALKGIRFIADLNRFPDLPPHCLYSQIGGGVDSQDPRCGCAVHERRLRRVRRRSLAADDESVFTRLDRTCGADPRTQTGLG